jgi:hypothetical protein
MVPKRQQPECTTAMAVRFGLGEQLASFDQSRSRTGAKIWQNFRAQGGWGAGGIIFQCPKRRKKNRKKRKKRKEKISKKGGRRELNLKLEEKN